MPPDLHCPACETAHDAGPDEPWRCDCGHPLEFAADSVPDADPPAPSALDRSAGLWAFRGLLPVAPSVTLGEGFTPLVEAPDWDAQFKLEYCSPTGSFKDRGAATTLSRAVELGVDTVVEDSSGNAGAAIATYAARAGLDAEIYVPASVSTSKLMAIQRTGARPVRVEGDREAVADACVEAVEDGDAWYASHAWNPAFYAGTATFAYEVAAQRDWTAPDAVVVPVGHGTLLLGAYRGFRRLRTAGVVESMPALYAAQAEGYAPIVEALAGDGADGSDATPEFDPDAEMSVDDPEELGLEAAIEAELSVEGGLPEEDPDQRNEVADAIHVRRPARKHQIVEAIRSSGGDAVALPEDAVELHLDELHRGGFYVEPTCAAGPAALELFREEGTVTEDDDVVVPLTGTGLKTL